MNRALIINIATGVLLIVGLVVGLALLDTSNEAVCLTSECVHTASRILNDLNQEVDPCDNFYDFACGGYLASALIPDDEISVNRISNLATDIRNQLRLLIEEPSSPNEARPFKLARTMYRTCMNTSAIENAGLEPLRKILRQFGNWPVIEGDNWKDDAFEWIESVYQSGKLGYSAYNFITLSVDVDWTNTTRHILVLDVPVLDLSRETLIQGVENADVKAYFDYMVDIAMLLGANKQQATEELGASLDFEIQLANIILPEEERRNYTLLHNPMTVAELQKQYPFIKWEEYINKLLPPTIHVNVNEVVTVRQPNFILELGELLKNTPKRVQANYALWRVTAESVQYLNEDVRKRETEYESAIIGNISTTSESRWKDCLDLISDSSLSITTTALYVRNHFKEYETQDVVEMITDIRNELIKTLKKTDWMDEKSRSRAVEKAVSMNSLVGYPIELFDDNELEKVYANFTLRPNDFLENMLGLNKLVVDYLLASLRKPVDESNWVKQLLYSMVVDAFYDPTENTIQISNDVVQGTFFSNDRPRYVNYGSLGFIIGHEGMHGFGGLGRQFNINGSLGEWWTPETVEKFLQKTQCIINQYDNYTVESVGLNVDGANTLEENIADNGGIKNAYQAYKEYVKRNGPEPKLPGLKYTPEQIFWISAASVWCTRYRPETSRYELTTDVHSPDRFRVIGSFANTPEFANDFKCPVGSYMNPRNKCSVF